MCGLEKSEKEEEIFSFCCSLKRTISDISSKIIKWSRRFVLEAPCLALIDIKNHIKRRCEGGW
jgi:hypothetical protein